MVSNARLDLPEPETPVTTVMALWGISKLMFLRLWTRAPVTTMAESSGAQAAARPWEPGAPSRVAAVVVEARVAETPAVGILVCSFMSIYASGRALPTHSGPRGDREPGAKLVIIRRKSYGELRRCARELQNCRAAKQWHLASMR